MSDHLSRAGFDRVREGSTDEDKDALYRHMATNDPLTDKVLAVLHDWGYDEANLTSAEEIIDALDPVIREDEKHKADLVILFWEHENKTLKARLAATEAVCGYREAELLALKGPCSTPECRLHYAHSGPCDIVKQR